MKRCIVYAYLLCLSLFCPLSCEESVIIQEVVAIDVQDKGFALKLNDEEAKVIDEIITTMGKNSVLALGFKQSHLRALGKKLNGVGCLQFLGYIFSNEELKTYMVNIRKSSMKWNGFIDGLKPGLNKEVESKKLYKELPGFANFLKVNYDILAKFANEGNWENFVGVLIEPT